MKLTTATLILSLLSLSAAAQEQYGVVFRTTDGAATPAQTDRIQIQSSADLARVLMVNSFLDMGGQRIEDFAVQPLLGDPAGPQPEGRMIWRSDTDQLKVWDATSATWVTIGGAAAGVISLNGLTGNLSIAVSNGNTVSTAGSTITVAAPSVLGSTGISVSFIAATSSWELTNTGDTDPSDDLTAASTATGDLSGTLGNPTVARIQGRAVSSALPASGDVLKWDALSSTWAPAADADALYSNGAGLNLTGTTFSVSFAGSGIASTAARSDHDHDTTYSALTHNHDAAYVNTSGAEMMSGSLGIGQAPAMDEKLIVVGTQGSIIVR